MTPSRYPTRKSVGYNKARTKQSYTCSNYAKRGPRGPRASTAGFGVRHSTYDHDTNQRAHSKRLKAAHAAYDAAMVGHMDTWKDGPEPKKAAAKKAPAAKKATAKKAPAKKAPAKKAPAKKKPIEIPSIAVNINTTPAVRTSGRIRKQATR